MRPQIFHPLFILRLTLVGGMLISASAFAQNRTRARSTSGSQVLDVTLNHQAPAQPLPPTAPDGLLIAARRAAELDLAWNASTPGDGRTIAHYDILRNGAKVGETLQTQATVNYAPAGAMLEYFSVRAVDDRGKVSPASQELLAPRDNGPLLAGIKAQFKQATGAATKTGFLALVNRTQIYRTAQFSSNASSHGYYDKQPQDFDSSLVYNATFDLQTGKWTRTASGTYADVVAGVTGTYRMAAPPNDARVELRSASGVRIGSLFTPVGTSAPWNAIGTPTSPFEDQHGILHEEGTITSATWGDSYYKVLHRELSLTDEYTDSNLRDQAAAYLQSSLARLPDLGWGQGASASEAGLFVNSLTDSAPVYLAERTYSVVNGANSSLRLTQTVYRLRAPRSEQPQRLRWAEVYYPADGTASQVFQVRDVVLPSSSTESYTEEFPIAPPQGVGGVKLEPAGSSLSVTLPVQATDGSGPRLYVANALFTNQTADMNLNLANAAGTTSVILTIAGSSVTLVAIDPNVDFHQGRAAALADGQVIASGTDLWTLPNRPGVGGWPLVAVGTQSGAAYISFAVTTYGSTQTHTYPLSVYPLIELAVDANRDGTIKLSSENNSDTTSITEPFRIWINDDNDSGDVGGDDIPGKTSGANCADGVVNGTRDLVDFFPVFLDLKQIQAVLLSGASVKYKLKQAGNAVNFVYTNLVRETTSTHDGAQAYHRKILKTGFGPNFIEAAGEATTQQITSAGIELSSKFLAGVKDSGWGVLLLEGRAASTAPLVLTVEKDGNAITEVKLELRISNVEGMFRHLNLRSAAKNYNGSPAVPSDLGLATTMGDPGDPLPDSTTNGKYFVFVHGYNVDAVHDRGWEAEIFKRMFVMGSRARFVGVSWFGSTGVDYHKAVFHAFQTGDVLNGQLGLSAGVDVTVVAHSLGNMVVSQAIQSGGFSPSRYYMINAAVPLEAYDYNNGSVTAEQRTAMTEHKWKTESASIFSANWHQLFGATPSDHRNELKWKDRFNGVLTSTTVYNFHSPGDDVVENPKWDDASILGTILAQGFNFSRGAWVTGEFAKGADIFEFPAIAVFSRVQGGWGQSVDYWPSGPSLRSADQTRQPYFGDFIEDGLFDSDATKASAKAGDKIVQYDLLASGIPALSFSTAVNPLAPLDAIGQNFNMEAQGRTEGLWPTEGHTDSKSAGRWLHSDFRKVALPYVHKMYQEMINKGALK